MMDDKVFLGKRRDRSIATILSFKERECDRYLPQEVSVNLRKMVLDEVNELCDLALDLLSSDQEVVWNDDFMDRLDDIYEKVSKIAEV
jgi:hypothetical protein